MRETRTSLYQVDKVREHSGEEDKDNTRGVAIVNLVKVVV